MLARAGGIPSRDGGDIVKWPENRKWIQQGLRGDKFIMTMDPNKLPTAPMTAIKSLIIKY